MSYTNVLTTYKPQRELVKDILPLRPLVKTMEEIVIIGAARTPIGSFNGCLSSIPATQLGKVAVEEALKRANVKPADVSEVYLGQVYTAGKM